MILIHDAGELGNRTELVYNPLSELSLSLDLLCHPEHHKLHTVWAETVLNSLSQKERQQMFYVELTIFAFPHLVVSDRHKEGYFFIGWDVPFRNDRLIVPGIERISTAAFALSDKSRLRIILMLSECPMTRKDLSRLMGFAKSTISRHVNILIKAGLVIFDSGERNSVLRLDKTKLKTISSEILDWVDS